MNQPVTENGISFTFKPTPQVEANPFEGVAEHYDWQRQKLVEAINGDLEAIRVIQVLASLGDYEDEESNI